MGKKKYNTEEERIAVKRERCRRWREKNKEKTAEYNAEYRKNNKEKLAEYGAEYRKKNKVKKAEYDAEYRKKNKEKIAEYRKNNKEKIAKKHAEWYQQNKEKIAEDRRSNKEKIAANREAQKRHYQKNKEKKAAYRAEYRANNKEKILEQRAEYRSTPFGRAAYLVGAYRLADKKHNRGECTIDAQWIVDNVFSGQVCNYCGESDWMKLGCDRKDSSLPHTPENCVPCCKHCNDKKNTTPYDLYMKMIGKIA